jgi:hypothetical protein
LLIANLNSRAGCVRSEVTACEERSRRGPPAVEVVCTSGVQLIARARPGFSAEPIFYLARNSRSFTASTTRDVSSAFLHFPQLCFQFLVRFCCRSTHSVHGFLRSSSALAARRPSASACDPARRGSGASRRSIGGFRDSGWQRLARTMINP